MASSIDAFSVGTSWEVPSLVVEAVRFVYHHGFAIRGDFQVFFFFFCPFLLIFSKMFSESPLKCLLFKRLRTP